MERRRREGVKELSAHRVIGKVKLYNRVECKKDEGFKWSKMNDMAERERERVHGYKERKRGKGLG